VIEELCLGYDREDRGASNHFAMGDAPFPMRRRKRGHAAKDQEVDVREKNERLQGFFCD
jgi:hypothetical protein